MNKKKKNRFISFFGFLVFIVGIIGILDYYWTIRQEKLEQFLPGDVALFSQINLNNKEARELNKIFPESSIETLLSLFSQGNIPPTLIKGMHSWIGQEIGIALFEDKNFMLAFEYRTKDEVENFMENFKTPEETFNLQKFPEVEILTPNFSSNIAFGFHGKWFLVSSSPDTIKKVFSSTEKLTDTVEYNQVKEDTSISSLGSIYVNTKKFINIASYSPKYATFKPILDTVAQTLPTIGMTVVANEKGIVLQSKFLSQNNFQLVNAKDDPIKNMPILAQYASKDILFFTNGSDLFNKYKETKEFLSKINPQFSLIFDGLLRAKFKELFGENFDFEKQFISFMHGKYAILIDFEDDLYPFMHFTFLTEFGGEETEKILSEFHEAIKTAQSQFTTKVEEITLPDGTIRKELVSVNKDDISIETIQHQNDKYFTVNNGEAQKKFSYGFIDDYFIFSTHEDGIRSVLSNKNQTHPNLSENEDFRESILFQFSPSHSYGFINASKLVSSIEYLSEKPVKMTSLLKENFRTAVFARKVLQDMIIVKTIFFSR